MKYTIELTNKQKAQMDCMIDIVHRYVGFNPKLEPIEASWESKLDENRKQAFERFNAEERETLDRAWNMLEERKQGKWIIDDKEHGRIWHCHCSNCKKDPQDYIGGSEDSYINQCGELIISQRGNVYFTATIRRKAR